MSMCCCFSKSARVLWPSPSLLQQSVGFRRSLEGCRTVPSRVMSACEVPMSTAPSYKLDSISTNGSWVKPVLASCRPSICPSTPFSQEHTSAFEQAATPPSRKRFHRQLDIPPVSQCECSTRRPLGGHSLAGHPTNNAVTPPIRACSRLVFCKLNSCMIYIESMVLLHTLHLPSLSTHIIRNPPVQSDEWSVVHTQHLPNSIGDRTSFSTSHIQELRDRGG